MILFFWETSFLTGCSFRVQITQQLDGTLQDQIIYQMNTFLLRLACDPSHVRSLCSIRYIC